MPRRYLITGGAGFIGSNFVRYALGHEADAFVTAFTIAALCFLVFSAGSLQGAFMPKYQHHLVLGEPQRARGLWRMTLAADLLAERLASAGVTPGSLVLAIPRGGVAIGAVGDPHATARTAMAMARARAR